MAKNQIEIQERHNKIIEYYKRNFTPDAMAGMLGVSASTIRLDIAKLRKDKKLPRARAKKNVIFYKIAELYNQGYTTKEIAQKTCMSKSRVREYITMLRKNEKIPEKKPRRIGTDKANVLDLYNKGLTQEEIAEELNMPVTTVSNHISKLRGGGEIEKSEEFSVVKGKRQKQIVEFYNRGISQANISRILGLSYSSINGEVKELREAGVISYSQDQITIPELAEQIKADGYKKQDVRFLVDIYIKMKMYDNCINLLNCYSENHDLSAEEIKNIELIQKKLKGLKKKQEFEESFKKEKAGMPKSAAQGVIVER